MICSDCIWRLTRLLSLISVLNLSCTSSSNCQTGDIRLAGGSSYLEGRVEVCFRGSWGTVCDDSWDGTDANVACRQLGYSETGAQAFSGGSTFGVGQGMIFLDDLLCNGNESSLFECQRNSDCFLSEAAGVLCQNDDVLLLHKGKAISNNSLLPLNALAHLNDTNSVSCVTTLTPCCDTNRTGDWFPPDSSSPLGTSSNPTHLYQSWGNDQSIQLHRPSGVSSIENGLYHCEVPDRENVIQTLYVGIYASLDDGTVRISSLMYETSSQTLVCTSTGGPATSVYWTKDGEPLAVDGITYHHSQIITDTASATYENRLNIIVKETKLSGLYTCTVQNPRSDDSSQLVLTVCRDGDVRYVDSNLEGPRIEICKDDISIKLESNFQVESEDSSVRDLIVSSISADSVVLSWRAVDPSIVKYDISCSSSYTSITTYMVKGAESAILTYLPPSSDYQCCVRAYLNKKLTKVATYISTSCVDVNIQGGSVTEPYLLIYFLAGLVGFLLVTVGVLAVGCFCVTVSKRKSQNTHPSLQKMDASTVSSFLVNNPIYKTNSTVSSLVSSTTANLINVNEKLEKSSPAPMDNHRLATNPQYTSTHIFAQHSQQSSDVSEKEPAYELIPGSQKNVMKPNGIVRTSVAEEDHIYSEPVPPVTSKVPQVPSKVRVVSNHPEYTAILANVGEGEDYAKLNYSK